MKIVAAGIYDVDFHPWKPSIILRLVTDEGIYGLGVTLNEDLVARCPRIHIA